MRLRSGLALVIASQVFAAAFPTSVPASAMWEVGVQVTESSIGAMSKDNLFAARADSVFAHQFFRDCFSAACNGRQAQGYYMNADSTLDWPTAFTNRYLLVPDSTRSQDIRALVDPNDVPHCVFEFFPDSTDGVNVDIGYKRRDGSSWPVGSHIRLSEIGNDSSICCNMHTDTSPKMFLEETSGMLHAIWEFKPTPSQEDSACCPDGWVAYSRKAMSDPDSLWDPVTLMTDQMSHIDADCSGPFDTDINVQLFVDSYGTIHLLGKASYDDMCTPTSHSVYQRWTRGHAPAPFDTTGFLQYPLWSDSTVVTTFREWAINPVGSSGGEEPTDPPGVLAEGTGYIYDTFGTPANASTPPDGFMGLLITRISVTSGDLFTGYGSPDPPREIVPAGIPRVLKQGPSGGWHVLFSAPDSSGTGQIWYTTTPDTDPYLASFDGTTPGTWSTPVPITGDSQTGATEVRAGLIVGAGDSTWISYTVSDTTAANLDGGREMWFRRGGPIDNVVPAGASETWEGVVFLDADFKVAATGTLTVEPGTLVYCSSTDENNVGVDARVEVIVEGLLLAEGTSSSPIAMTSEDPNSPGGWYGIRFVDTADSLSISSLKNVEFDAAFYAITVDSLSGNIFDCTFSNSDSGDIYVDRDTRVIEGYEWRLQAPTDVVAKAASDGGDVSRSGEDTLRVEVVVNGRLTTSDPLATGERVKFVATTSDAFAGKAWYGVSVEGTGWGGDGIGVGRIADAYFDSAVYPLSFLAADTAEVVDSHFFRYEQTAITDWASDAEIKRNAVVRDLLSTLSGNNRAGRVGIHVASSFAEVESDTVFSNTDKGIWIEGTYGDCLAAPSGTEKAILVRDNQVIQDNPVVINVEESGVVLRWICHERDVVMESNNIQGWGGRGVVLDQVSDVHLECNCISGNEYGVLHQRKYVPIDPVWDGVNTFFQNNVAKNGTVNVQAKTAPVGTTDGGLRFGEQSNPLAGENRSQMLVDQTLHYEIRSYELNRTDHAEGLEWFDQNDVLMTDSTSTTILNRIEFGPTQTVSYAPFVSMAADTFGATGPPFCSTGALCDVPTRPAGGGSKALAGPGAGVPSDLPGEAPHGPEVGDATIRSPQVLTWSLDRLVPNPTGSGTSVTFTVPPSSGVARIAVYDVAGRRVAKLLDGVVEPGRHVVMWDGRDGGGRRVGSGVFFVRMVAGEFTQTRKLTVLTR